MRNYIHIFLIIIAISISCNSFAQVPQKMSYQSVIRNTEGNLVVNTAIGIQISILKDTPTGQAVYVETMTNTTNENGLLSIEIGGGTPILGSFSQIDWSTGTYFVKTETDPTGGTNYSIVGVGQLLSVPYAMYAGSSKNMGRATVIIDQGTTQEEATLQIAEEVGPNTETVIVENTQLTSLDLSGLTKVNKVIITGNLNLTSIDLSNLKKTYDSFTIDNNSQLTTINLSSLSYIANTFSIYSCGIQTLNIPTLTKLSFQTILSIGNNPNLNSISFPNLMVDSNNYSQIGIHSNISLNTVELPLLKSSNYIQIDGNENLTSLNLNSLENIFNAIFITSNKLTSLTLPNLVSCSNLNYGDLNTTSLNLPLLSNFQLINISNTSLNSFLLPMITNSTSIFLTNNNLLSTISFPELTTIRDSLTISNNSVLNLLNIPNLSFNQPTFLNQSNPLNINNNALPSSQINWWLNKLSSATTFSGKIFNLSNQTPPAPPTGQGLLDKQTLIDAGNSVITD